MPSLDPLNLPRIQFLGFMRTVVEWGRSCCSLLASQVSRSLCDDRKVLDANAQLAVAANCCSEILVFLVSIPLPRFEAASDLLSKTDTEA